MMIVTPCKTCKHYKEDQVSQFEYMLGCEKDAPSYIFMSEWGCCLYETEKGNAQSGNG